MIESIVFWNWLSIGLLVVEALLLAGFVVGRLKNKKLNETVVFLGLVFFVSFALYMIPYLYSLLVRKDESNLVFDTLERISKAVKLFLGSVDTAAVRDFTLEVPVYTATYLLGAVLALLATVSAAVEVFSHTLRNRFRLARVLKASSCDIVLGHGERALHYANSNPDTVVLLGDDADKSTVETLMEEGYIVLRRSFSEALLNSRLLDDKTRYHVVCPNEKDSALEILNTYLSYRKNGGRKNIHLYAEVEDRRAETVRREILEKSGCAEDITTFSSVELLARTFTEEHPVTEYLPADFVDSDTSMKPECQIHMYLLGFGELSQEIYRQSVMNNQLVTFENGQYRVHPVHYHIVDADPHAESWCVGGLQDTLQELHGREKEYFPLPELPYMVSCTAAAPHLRSTLSGLTGPVWERGSYHYFVIDTGDVYRNVETGTRLRAVLDGCENYHLFIRSDAAYAEDDPLITYYGDFAKVFTHDVIVNDSLSAVARKLNEVYTAEKLRARKNEKDFRDLVKAEADKSWKEMNYFTRYSNIHAALNLRLKLNLMGLDYVKDGKGEKTGLVASCYQRRDGAYDYSEYQDRSMRNALLAQEHARWNAYHMIREYLPMEKKRITEKGRKDGYVSFHTKSAVGRKHACLTTFCGLDELSGWLAKKADELTGIHHEAADYDFYVYDEMLILSAAQLMTELGFSVKVK